MTTDGPARIAGAVLCGGKSRRYGADKALAEIGGRPMAERVCAVLADAGCEPVVVVGGDAERLSAATGRRVVADSWPGQGPLGGVIDALSALEPLGATGVVVAACDLPDLSVDAVLAVAGGSTARVASTGRLDPSLTYWPVDVTGRLAEVFDSGIRSLHEALDAVTAVPVDVDAAALRNVNEPDGEQAGH